MADHPLYDRIGVDYNLSRAADGRIVGQIVELLDLPWGSTIADVGAGTGNYSHALAEAGFRILAVEPSAEMRAQARVHDCITWHEGTAEALPLTDRSVDGVVSTLASHHFTSLADAAAEMHRVSPSGPIVLFTIDPREGEELWFADYFPEIYQRGFEIFPPLSKMADLLTDKGRRGALVTPFLLPRDLEDLFMHAGWNRPELYLDAAFRRNTSGFAQADASTVERGLGRLADNLASGKWDAHHGHLRARANIDAGYRFVSWRAR